MYEYLSENFKDFNFKWRQKENRRLFFNNKTKRWLECDILVYKNNTLFLGIEVNGKLFHDSDDVRYRDSIKIEQSKQIEGFKLFHVWSDNVEEDVSNVVLYLTTFDK